MGSMSQLWINARSTLIRALPARITDKLRGNETAKRVGSNVAWLGADKLYSTAVTFIVSIYVARYLGRTDFGLFSYTLAFVTIFQVPATLGLDEILVRELVRNAKEQSQILGTALIMRLGSGTLMMGAIAIAVRFARPHDEAAQRLVMITSLLLIPQAFYIIQRLYNARLLAKFNVIAGNIALTLVAIMRLAMVHFHASLTWFVLTNVALFVFNVIALYAIYLSDKERRVRWTFSTRWFKQLLRDAWPQIPSGIAGSVQNQIGALIIGSFMGDDQLGPYAVAYRFYVLLLVVPDIVCQSLSPSLTRAKAISDSHFELRLSQSYRLMLGMYVVSLLPLLFLGLGGIRLLYGAQFAEAGPLMLCFAVPLMMIYVGQLRLWYIVIENQLRYSMFISLAQAGVSIIANYILIRRFGAVGAVGAIVCAAIVVFAADAVFTQGRRNTRAIVRAFSFK